MPFIAGSGRRVKEERGEEVRAGGEKEKRREEKEGSRDDFINRNTRICLILKWDGMG